MIFIRADANEYIGTGHVMRCLAIADALFSLGEDVIFITAYRYGDALINSKGYKTICLDSNWMQMDSEIQTLIALLEREKPSKIIVDSYYVTNYYFESISHYTKIVYFDDFNKKRWNIDQLINYNIYAKELDYKWYLGTKTELYLGTYYTPLRSEFKGLPKHKINNDVKCVLISAGGSDPTMMTEKILLQVCPNWENIDFHFVIGALNPRTEDIKKMAGSNVILHINEKNMSELMLHCDIAVSASGTTLYELCACGIPTITYIIADNQILSAEKFHNDDIMVSAGDCREDSAIINKISYQLDNLINNKDNRCKYSIRMQNLVDGYGADRIAECLAEG